MDRPRETHPEIGIRRKCYGILRIPNVRKGQGAGSVLKMLSNVVISTGLEIKRLLFAGLFCLSQRSATASDRAGSACDPVISSTVSSRCCTLAGSTGWKPPSWKALLLKTSKNQPLTIFLQLRLDMKANKKRR
jgi:hypothetical protein